MTQDSQPKSESRDRPKAARPQANPIRCPASLAPKPYRASCKTQQRSRRAILSDCAHAATQPMEGEQNKGLLYVVCREFQRWKSFLPSRNCTLALAARAQKILQISFSPSQTARQNAGRLQFIRRGKRPHLLDRLLMQRHIAHNPALANIAPLQLKLRLNQNQKFRSCPRHGNQRRQYLRNRNKRNIRSNKINRLRNRVSLQVAHIAFERPPARILQQFPTKLCRIHIQRKNFQRPMRQQTIRKPARRTPCIQTNATSRRNPKIRERSLQLQSTAARITLRIPGNRDRHILSNQRSRLTSPLPIHDHVASQQHSL